MSTGLKSLSVQINMRSPGKAAGQYSGGFFVHQVSEREGCSFPSHLTALFHSRPFDTTEGNGQMLPLSPAGSLARLIVGLKWEWASLGICNVVMCASAFPATVHHSQSFISILLFTFFFNCTTTEKTKLHFPQFGYVKCFAHLNCWQGTKNGAGKVFSGD